MNLKNQLLRTGHLVLLLSPVVLLVACGKMSARNDAFASKAGETVGCQSFQESFWNELYKFPEDGQSFPSAEEMRESFDRVTAEGRLSKLSQSERLQISDALTELYRLLALDSVKTLGLDGGSSYEKLATLTALEIGDRTTSEKEVLQEKIAAEFAKVQSIFESSEISQLPSCSTPKPDAVVPPGPPSVRTLFSTWKTSRHPVVYGALKTFATSYQSCSATGVAALSTTTADVKGIKITGTHPDGIGSKRSISSVSELISSHPYLRNFSKPVSSCFDVSATPLIYDYGGRPVTSSSTGKFDMFKNAGSGTAVLGTDCSGYVFMALATGGLRIKKDSTLRASTVHGVTSRLFLDPQKNGMTCLDFARFSGADTLRAGDIIAKAGHVFIVGAVGKDPFGIGSIKSVGDCTTAKMSTDRFDFTILQSSTSKNGIGIHAHKAASYLPESPDMSTGLLTHAVNACKAKFGTAATSRAPGVTIVRHSGASGCKDKEVQMERESCVSSCAVTTTAANDLD